MDKPQRHVRVTRNTEQRSPRSVRRLGQALIALAQAQLEAEAQAQAQGQAEAESKTKAEQGRGKSGRAEPPSYGDNRPRGDAA